MCAFIKLSWDLQTLAELLGKFSFSSSFIIKHIWTLLLLVYFTPFIAFRHTGAVL